jgi:hypothetical protein
VLRYRRQAPRCNPEETLLSVSLGQPPALDQVKIELPVALQHVLFVSGQGWHAIKLHKTTMSPNVA